MPRLEEVIDNLREDYLEVAQAEERLEAIKKKQNRSTSVLRATSTIRR